MTVQLNDDSYHINKEEKVTSFEANFTIPKTVATFFLQYSLNTTNPNAAIVN